MIRRRAATAVGLLLVVLWLLPLVDDVGVSAALARMAVCGTFVVAADVATLRGEGDRIARLMVLVVLLLAGELGIEEDTEPWRFTVGLALQDLWLVALAALVLAFPHGRLDGRWARVLVGGAASVALAARVAEVLWRAPGAPCLRCPPAGNVLLRGPAPFDLERWTGRADDALAALLLLAAVTVAVRVVRAPAPGRRALLPVAVPALLLTAKLVLDAQIIEDRLIDYPADELLLVSAPNAVLLAAVPLGFLVGASRTSGWRTGVGRLLADLDDVRGPGDLEEAIARALGDRRLRVDYWAQPLQRFVTPGGAPVADPDGRQAATVVDGEGGPQARLVHDRALLGEPALLRSVAAAARLALENERLQAEVRAQLAEVVRSRARILEAADGERRRIERDLHDGAQQRLVSLRIATRLLRSAVDRGSGPDTLHGLLDELDAQTDDALGLLRDLARGIHPSLLTEEGLGVALESLADRTATPVMLGAVVEDRLPAAIEVALYYACSEALVNADKHAGADTVRLEVVRDRDAVLARIVDDGCGGAAETGGTGLRGLRDRIEAVGGTLVVASPPGGGTTVSARIPLRDAG